MQTPTDAQLHELARKRVDFRAHLTVYFIVNAVLWFVWYFTGRGYMWPIWPMAGWGIGVLFHYIFDYRTTRFLSESDEFEKLKRQFEKQRRIES